MKYKKTFAITQLRKYLAVIFIFTIPLAAWSQVKHSFTVSGTITEKNNGETLTGASIGFVGHPAFGVLTNAYGFYSITLPGGNYLMTISFQGFVTDSVSIDLKNDMVINKMMSAAGNELQTVVVSSKKKDNILKTSAGMQRLSMEDIKAVPVLFGEKDVLKTIQLLPGIKSGGDGKAGFFVRGGGADQNLILLDEATVYNASHVLGFFSVFNSDAIKDITLYKGGMPANYGGRLASVEDIQMKNGSDQKFGMSGGLGIIASRLNFEGPIVKDKGSFMVSARRSYADIFTSLSSDTNTRGTKLYFYDINAKANYKLNNNNRIFLSGYFGKDYMQLKHFSSNNRLDYGNQTATFRLNHVFSNKIFSNTSIIYSNYDYNAYINNSTNNITIASQITDYHVKQDFNYYFNANNKIDIGFDAIYHITQPGQSVGTQTSIFNNITLQKKYAYESAIYASNEWTASQKLKLTYGLRFSMLNVVGAGNFYTYDAAGKILTTTYYGIGKIVRTYINPEPRIAASYQLNNLSSIKLAYDRTIQNIHLLNNSTGNSPTNVYLPTTNIVQPEISDQFSFGYYRNFHENMYEFSSELYYKTMQNQIDYKDGANLIGNDNVEADLLFGKGRAYGWESYIKKKYGKLTGWISYTLSNTERQIDGINKSNWYNATQDQTHNLAIVGIYQASKKWTLSATWVYNTGNATSWPSGKFPVDGVPVYYYAARNDYRMPAYHRLDLGATVITKKTAKWEGSWSFSIYNAYGRDNPYSISFQQDTDNPLKTQVQQTTLFKMVPSITYNFKF